MKTTKKPDVATIEPPADWVRMQLAIPPQCWELFTRVALRVGCEPGDIINHILQLGYEGHALHERENHVHAKETRH